MKELVALARAQPGALNFASGGPGSSTHLGVELLKYVAKIDLVHIPYKGTGPAVADVLGGQVTMMFAGISSVKQHVEVRQAARDRGDGREALAGDAEGADVRRSRDEAGRCELLLGRARAGAHAADVVERVSSDDGAGAQDARRARRSSSSSASIRSAATPEEYAPLLASETDKWAKVIKAANIRLD